MAKAARAVPAVQLLPAPGPITWATRNVQPLAPFFVTTDDQIQVVLFTNQVSAPLEVVARVQERSGKQTFPQRSISTIGATTAETYFMNLVEGFLISVAVRELTGATPRGSLYIQLALVQGGAVGTGILLQLAAGYATAFKAITWPPTSIEHNLEGRGFYTTLLGTDPAAGVEISEAVLPGNNYFLHSMNFQLVTAAGGAARRVHLEQANVADLSFLRTPAPADQAGGTTVDYFVGEWGYPPAGVAGEQFIAIPPGIRLPSSMTLRTVTSNLAAGDNYGAPRMLVERLMGLPD